jgi:amino acid transporter
MRWNFKRFFLGDPLATKAITHERLTNAQGLAIFASDALSSTAYSTEEILLVLAALGTGALHYSLPIAGIIAALIFIVAFSYRQVIHAYPEGGGVYNVARKNLGETPALIGASSLLIDYVLTVAVSVTAGVAAITSAFPELYSHRVFIGIVVVLFLMWMNLRGIRESGRIFSLPTYLFITTFLGMIAYGAYRYFTDSFPSAASPDLETTPSLLGGASLFLIVRAFAAGCTAMTGIETISNGVQAFKKPESENAAKTLLRMAVLLASIFLGLTFLSVWGRVLPLEGETVISQIARLLFNNGPFYFLVQGATALILLLAANTPFAGFPRVASQLAKDGYFPRQFLNLGSRLVFANGIIVLSLAASFLIAFFGGNVHAIIPLYAVGVFLGFSISQLGMIRHWFLMNGKKYFRQIILNAAGFVSTSVVLAVVFISKFNHGAWALVPVIGLLFAFMKSIKRHYNFMERKLALDGKQIPDVMPKKTMVMVVSRMNKAVLYTLKFVKSFQPAHIKAVHVAIDQEEADKFKAQWEKYIPDVPIDIIISEYRDLIGPILSYLKNIEKEWNDDQLIVVIPEIIPERFWHHFLHNQTALRLRFEIEQDPDIHAEILDVPIKITTKL